MKKLLYTGHTFHNRTKSSEFIQNLLGREYEITKFDFDPYCDEFEKFKELDGRFFDAVVLWQIMPPIEMLKKYVRFKHIAFFPMYDGAPSFDSIMWDEYRDVNIINFSSTLHKKCKEHGLSSFYIQYFPEAKEIKNTGDEKSAFLWERTIPINIETVDKTIGIENLDKLYLHRVPDPGHKLDEIPKEIEHKISVSTWFDTKEEMSDYMQECAIYFAPRVYEGIGMSFLDAMAVGRCVIAPDNPTMNEYIVHGENGYLYDLKNPKKINLENVRQVQENTHKFIKSGRKKWESERDKILDWITANPNENSDKKLMKKLMTKKKLKLIRKWCGYTAAEKIFSVKNNAAKTHKIITLSGLQLKIRRIKK